MVNMYLQGIDAMTYVLSSSASSFRAGEESEINHKKVIRYNGYIDPETAVSAYGKYIRSSYVEMGLLAEISEPTNEILEKEIKSGKVYELQAGIPSLAYAEEPIPISIWIEKDTNLLVKAVIDKKSAMQAVLDKVIEVSDATVNDFGPEPVYNKAIVTIEIEGINTIDKLEPPKELAKQLIYKEE